MAFCEQDLASFARQLATGQWTQPKLAEALFWFYDHFDPGREATIAQVAADLHKHGLTGPINRSRLASQLRSLGTIVKGAKPGHFKLKATARNALNSEYQTLLRAPVVTHDGSVIPVDKYLDAPSYLAQLCDEANLSFAAGCHDGCAVLCRRIAEGLLVGAFEKAGHADKVEKKEGYYHLRELIAAAESRKWIRLTKSAIPDLKEIKEIGDRAAHHRFAISSSEDIRRIGPKVRAVIQELRVLAGV